VLLRYVLRPLHAACFAVNAAGIAVDLFVGGSLVATIPLE
jgi:hypothetical protein